MGDPVWWIDENEENLVEFHQQTCSWVRSLGLDPDWLKPRAAVVRHGESFELHVDVIVPEGRGRAARFDPLNPVDLLAVRRIVEVPEGSWPARPVEVPA